MASEADLDDDIANLKARGTLQFSLKSYLDFTLTTPQVESLNAQLRVQLNGLLTTNSTRDAIHADASASALQDRLEKQQAYAQQCAYRICAGITTFRVRDPDPNAVDSGAVLGLRIEVMTRARFVRPYFVFLNRPYAGWRVHRHTVPPCIPLNGLAARYLPAPPKSGAEAADKQLQNLPRFARTLRREIVRYHNRVAVVADLRKALGLDGKRKDAKERAERCPIYSISSADAETKQIRIDWKDGRSGRLVLGDDGEVGKLVVLGERARDREATRELLSDGNRLEDVARRLAAV